MPNEKMRMPGVEPGSQAWEACMMPLHYMRHASKAIPLDGMLEKVIIRNMPNQLGNHLTAQLHQAD
jgi:hypothetical protein